LADLLLQLVNLYIVAVIGRILLSYFPLQPGGIPAQIFSFLYTITEPVLGPARRLIPPVGMFDFSPIIVIVALRIVANVIASSL
jgi:YggT family protein